MISLLVAFFTSLIATVFIIRTKNLHGAYSGDKDLDGPQKFHTNPVPRIGGIAIELGIFTAIGLTIDSSIESIEKLLLFFCALPAFGIGIAEGLTKKISVRNRLIFTAIGALLASILLDAKISNLGIPGIDYILMIPIISIIATVFSITGLANAYNIIDGFNGLSSMVGIIALIALGYMGYKLNDQSIFFLSSIMAAAVLGFFILNYPKGLIFLGDGGAYLIGFWIAVLSVLIVNRHHDISPWFAVLINAYPILETLFTIYRRKYHQGKSPGNPDGIHLHSLIFRRIVRPSNRRSRVKWFNANSKTSPYLWVLSNAGVVPALFFWDSTPLLITFMLIFIIFYIWLYKKMTGFKTPRWMFLK